MITLDKGGGWRADGHMFCDTDFTHVSSAVYDLSYAAYIYTTFPAVTQAQQEQRDPPDEMRRAFLEAYLTAMGDPATNEDVDLLLADVAVASLTNAYGPLSPFTNGSKSVIFRKFKAAVAELLISHDKVAIVDAIQNWIAKLLASDHEQLASDDWIDGFQIQVDKSMSVVSARHQSMLTGRVNDHKQPPDDVSLHSEL